MTGVGFGSETTRFGVGIGYASTDIDTQSFVGSADVETISLSGFASFGADALRATVGGSYGWMDGDGGRSVTLGTISNRLTSDFEGSTWQLFAELGYDIDIGSGTLTPLVRYAHIRSDIDDLIETGGATALSVQTRAFDLDQTLLGVEAAIGVGEGAQLTGLLGWQHAFGDRTGLSSNRFAGGNAFAVSGLEAAGDAARVELGLQTGIGGGTLSARYAGSFADAYSSHGGRVVVSFGF